MKRTITNISKTNHNSAQVLKNDSLAIPNGMYGPLRLTNKSRLMRFFLLASPLLIALLVGTPAYAQDMTSEIDKIFSWATTETPGCAVAVSHKGQVVVNCAYGLADLERKTPITPNTVFDIGSVQKQFIAAAILILVEEGRLSLSDDIHKYIPELPNYGYIITIDHLLTHTSGIRDWFGLKMLADGDDDALTLILRHRGLNFAPGEKISYSTSGYVLARKIVERAAGMPFSQFVQERLFNPLGMENTTYRDDPRVLIEDRALAYEKQGDSWKRSMLLGNDRGGGALFSTAGDLIIWNEALASGRLGAFVTEKLHEPARLNNGRELGYARGLFLDANRGGKVVWHSGSAAGYKSLLSRFPEQDLSIAILCNSGDGTNRIMFSRRIFDMFVPGMRDRGVETTTTIEVEDIDMSSKAGLFVSERTGELLRLIAHEGRLRIIGGPVLIAVAENRFRNPEGSLSFRSGDEFELHFLSEDEFELISMEGEVTQYHRAALYEPTPAELKAFEGSYENKDLDSSFQVKAGENGVVVQLNNSQDKIIEFRPVYRDTFQAGRMMVRFHRDEDGNVVSLSYSNPALRNVRFTRLSDDTP